MLRTLTPFFKVPLRVAFAADFAFDDMMIEYLILTDLSFSYVCVYIYGSKDVQDEEDTDTAVRRSETYI